MAQAVRREQRFNDIRNFRMVLISDLVIDPEAQGKLRMNWVKSHAAKFDPDQLGYILVNRRVNGKIYIVDGQHRVMLMREVGWGDQNILAEYWEGLTQAEEAKLFLARNDRKPKSLYEKFRVSVTSGDPEAVHVDRIVQAHGLVVSDQVRDGHICAVDSLVKIYRGGGIAGPKEGPDALSKALMTTVQAWGRQPSSVNGKVIQGLGMVFLRYNGVVKQDDLVRKLAPFPGGSPGLLGKARSAQEIHGRPLHHCVASLVVDIYNKGRKEVRSRLESWEE